jgi:hypothetical protein
MVRAQKRYLLMLALALVLSPPASAQMLRGDRNFPVLNELNWNMSMEEVQSICQKNSVLESAKDSLIVLAVSFFGCSTRTEIQFDKEHKTLKLVQAKFKEPTKAAADTLLQHLTAICGRPPYRTVKEKSLLIVTIRMQMAVWRSPTEIVNLVTATGGDSIFDLSLVLFPPTKQQDPKPGK